MGPQGGESVWEMLGGHVDKRSKTARASNVASVRRTACCLATRSAAKCRKHALGETHGGQGKS